ncbi:MAG TPA: VanZ family protein, partial [Dehalococcoidia bacterium]
WRMLAAVVLVAGLFGVVIEAYQSTLEGREASAYDALANLAGAAFGALTAWWLAPRWNRLLAKP